MKQHSKMSPQVGLAVPLVLERDQILLRDKVTLLAMPSLMSLPHVYTSPVDDGSHAAGGVAASEWLAANLGVGVVAAGGTGARISANNDAPSEKYTRYTVVF